MAALFFYALNSVPVKDYSTPAIEQGLAAWSKVQGRRWIILRGGNRGVVATSVRL
jgi:hypothetical protein